MAGRRGREGAGVEGHLSPCLLVVFDNLLNLALPQWQGGEDILLTNENKEEYVRLSCSQRLVTSIRPQVRPDDPTEAMGR